MEAAGIEPASRDISAQASTCVVDSFKVSLDAAPIDRVRFALVENGISPQACST